MPNHDRRVKRDPQRGTWYFVADGPTGSDGRRRQIFRRGFPTARDANDALQQVLTDAGRGVVRDRRGTLVGTFLTDTWLPTLDGRDLRPTTRDSYRRIVANHLVPRLGQHRLALLDAVAVEAMLGELVRAGLSQKTCRNVVGVLSAALQDAKRWKVIGANPVAEARTPGRIRPTPKAWPARQLGLFLRRVEGDRLEPLWRYLMVTGCRRGEACGLRWDDVDLDAGTALVVNQRTLAGGRVVEGMPKTAAGAHTVALDAETVAMLRRWRSAQTAEFLRLGIRPAVSYVFTSESGTPLWPQRVTSNFRALCDELGLPRIGPHGLRHSMATAMIGAGQSPKLVSQRLGHADVSVTLNLYSHVLPGHDAAAAAAFAAVLDTKPDANVITT